MFVSTNDEISMKYACFVYKRYAKGNLNHTQSWIGDFIAPCNWNAEENMFANCCECQVRVQLSNYIRRYEINWIPGMVRAEKPVCSGSVWPRKKEALDCVDWRNRRGIDENYEKGSCLPVLCKTMHTQNLTFHFKFVMACSVLDSSHMLEGLLNVKLVYLVTCRYLDYIYMAFKARIGSGLCSKFFPNTGHEVPEAVYRYSSTLYLTWALGGGRWSTPCSGLFTPEKDNRYPLYRRLDDTVYFRYLEEFFSLPKRSNRLWDPPNLLFNGHRGFFAWG
jgi:hypothetical protein